MVFNSKKIRGVWWAACLLLLFSYQIIIADEFRDIGNSNDFSPNENIYFDINSDFSIDGWPFYWYVTKSADYPGTFTWFEKANEFRWATMPSNLNGWISSRSIRYRHFGRFRIDASSFSMTSNGNPKQNLFLTFRYKDDIRPGNKNGCPIFSWNGSRWILQGIIGGQNDHRWKTQQFIIEQNEVSAIVNRFIFKIGVTLYSDEIIGELPIDKIKLADDSDTFEFESDQDGIWPKFPTTFSNLGKTQEFVAGEGPFFPFGIHIGTLWVSHGGSSTTPGRGSYDTWQCMENSRMNMYSFSGWEQNWYSQWLEFPNESDWDDPGVMVILGLNEHLIQAAGHRLKVFPNTYTDTRAWWIKHQYGDESRVLDYLAQVAFDHKNNPALGAWYIVDEWDHEDGTHGKPHLFSRQLASRIQQADPSTPILILSMGFMGTTTWKITSESADVVVADVYPVSPFTFTDGLKLQAQRLDEMRSVLGNDGAFILMGMGYNYDEGEIAPVDNQRRGFLDTEILAQAYLGITHGSKGILFFCGNFGHPKFQSNNWPLEYSTRIWNGFHQVGDELFGQEGIAPILLSPSITLEIMGEKGIVSASDSDIHFILKQTESGQKFLIAVRASNTTSGNVIFKFRDLNLGESVNTRFENNRSISVQNGQFIDYFKPLERHVYQLSSKSTPIKFINFHAVTVGKKVSLSWSTASENNNLGFEIQRGLDSLNLQKIGFIKSSGIETAEKTYDFNDQNLSIGIYYYRLKQIDYDGNFSYSNVVQVPVLAPKTSRLYTNYPNPFNPQTTISYDLAESGWVELSIFDVMGNNVITLQNSYLNAGYYQHTWNGLNQVGQKVASSIYFYLLKVNNKQLGYHKMLMLK